MYRSRLIAQRLAAFFLFGWLLFNYPMLALFNRDAAVFGVPVLYAYIFMVWLAFILMVAFIIEGRKD